MKQTLGWMLLALVVVYVATYVVLREQTSKQGESIHPLQSSDPVAFGLTFDELVTVAFDESVPLEEKLELIDRAILLNRIFFPLMKIDTATTGLRFESLGSLAKFRAAVEGEVGKAVLPK